MIDPGLDSRVALVTGGNHGIGAAIARALAAQGAAVFISYLRLHPEVGNTPVPKIPGVELHDFLRSQTAASAVQSIKEAGGRVAAWEVDLADPARIPELFDRVETVFGPVEILVNNAAAWQADTFQPQAGRVHAGFPSNPLSPESIDAHFAVNSRALALLMAEFARRLSTSDKRWGRIVNLSTGGAHGFPGEVSYGASKSALESYSRAAAVELGPYGITVNVITPGPTQTGWITPVLEQEWSTRSPLGRIGQPDDIADVAVFLASEQARWVTGQVIHVSGGDSLL